MAIQGYKELGDARLLDLIAKTAHTSIKDTLRVLAAVRIVDRTFGGPGGAPVVAQALEDVATQALRPNSGNVAGCEAAHVVITKRPDNNADLNIIASYR